MADNVTLHVEGIERLQSKMRDPALIGQPLRELLDEASGIGQEAAVSTVDGGTGIAVNSIGREVQPLSARVFTAMPKERAQSIDQGRRPGDSRWLSLLQVAQWVRGRRLSRTAPLTGEERAEIVRVQQKIKQRGAKGKMFFQAARDAVSNDLPRLLRSMGQKVEGRWRR